MNKTYLIMSRMYGTAKIRKKNHPNRPIVDTRNTIGWPIVDTRNTTGWPIVDNRNTICWSIVDTRNNRLAHQRKYWHTYWRHIKIKNQISTIPKTLIRKLTKINILGQKNAYEIILAS